MIKFSIIVPVYNVFTYLHQCIDSIRKQTYENLEIICLDDGSTDGSGEILDGYAVLDHRIMVIHKVNSGYGQTLNLGISKASGDYIGIVESDDFIAPDMFEKFANIIENTSKKLDVIKASYSNFSEGGSIYKMLFKKEKCNKIITPLDYMDLFFIQISIWSAVYRKDFLIKNDIYFLESKGASYQDISFCFKVWAVAKQILLINDSVYFYRIDNEMSSVNSVEKIFCVYDEICEIDSYFEKHQIATPILNGLKYAFMGKTYLWNYYHLHIGMRAAFWVLMVQEFKKMEKSPDFEIKYWREDEWIQVQRVLENPEKFFWNTNPCLSAEQLDRYTIKNLVYKQFLTQYMGEKSKIIIYGAGAFGHYVWNFMKINGWQDKVIGFAVTRENGQSDIINGKRVCEIEKYTAWKNEALVVVAVKEKSQQFILSKLKSLQFINAIRVDCFFIELMKEAEVWGNNND